ncbi:MAG: hypothetical protein Q9198_003567, partial [Flavoplaca austrocitrina]
MSSGLLPTVKLVAEPEAATLPNLKTKPKHGTMEDLVEDDAPKINDAFVVCDIGGGTVVTSPGPYSAMSDSADDCFEDLISYEVQQVEPLKIKERVIEDGTQILREPETTARLTTSNAGPLRNSLLLDKSFQTNIETIVGGAQRNDMKQGDRVKRVKKFDYGIQKTLSEKNSQTYSVDLQEPEHGNRSNGGTHTAGAT